MGADCQKPEEMQLLARCLTKAARRACLPRDRPPRWLDGMGRWNFALRGETLRRRKMKPRKGRSASYCLSTIEVSRDARRIFMMIVIDICYQT